MNIPELRRASQSESRVEASVHGQIEALASKETKDGKPYWELTLADAEGKFTIPNVPAGEPLEFQVWHEGGTAAGNGLVGTTPAEKDVKWSNRGRMSITLQPDEKKDIKVVVPAKAIHG